MVELPAGYIPAEIIPSGTGISVSCMPDWDPMKDQHFRHVLTTSPVRGIVKFILPFASGGRDQYLVGGNSMAHAVVPLTPLLTRLMTLPALTAVTGQMYLQSPTGTVVGIKAWPDGPPRNLAEVVAGLEPLNALPAVQQPTQICFQTKLEVEDLTDKGLERVAIRYVLYPYLIVDFLYEVIPDPLGSNFRPLLKRTFLGGVIAPFDYCYFAGTITYLVDTFGYTEPYGGVCVINLTKDTTPAQAWDVLTTLGPKYYHIYHTHKQGTEITPGHGSIIFEGLSATIRTYPLANRELVSFTVDGVERLPEAILPSADITPEIAKLSGYQPGMAQYQTPPATADIYVGSIATVDEEEFDVTAGIEFTKQFTTTDCYTDSWAISYSTLPEEVEISISATGLLKIYVPPDVYAGNPGGQYYIEITFKGYSETVVKYYKITLLEMPAFGTVWTAQDLLAGGSVRDIFVDSNDDIYITTAAKVFKTTSELTTFTEMTLTGTIVSYLGNIQEVADGRLILSDRTGIWIKAVGSDEFVRQSLVLTNWSGAPAVRLAAGPDDNFFFVTHSSNTGLVTYIDRYNLDSLGAYKSRYTNNETVLTFYPQPIRAAEGTWCFMVGGMPTAGCALIRYADGVFTRLIQDILVDGSGTGAGSFTMEDSGRIWLAVADQVDVDYKCQTRYSDDAGATWSEPQLATTLANNENVSLTALKENYGVFGLGSAIYRSADGYATTGSVQTLDGNVNVIKMIKYRKLLAGTSGATANLYLSEA